MFLIPGMIAAALAARPGSGFSLTNPDTALAQWLSLYCRRCKGIVTIAYICIGRFFGGILQLMCYVIY